MTFSTSAIPHLPSTVCPYHLLCGGPMLKAVDSLLAFRLPPASQHPPSPLMNLPAFDQSHLWHLQLAMSQSRSCLAAAGPSWNVSLTVMQRSAAEPAACPHLHLHTTRHSGNKCLSGGQRSRTACSRVLQGGRPCHGILLIPSEQPPIAWRVALSAQAVADRTAGQAELSKLAGSVRTWWGAGGTGGAGLSRRPQPLAEHGLDVLQRPQG